MNDKTKFGYEDAVNYVLEKMDAETRKKFEEELKFNVELQEFVNDAIAKKDILLKYDEFEPDEEFYEITYKKVKNLFKVITDIKPGQIYLIDSSGLNEIEKELINDLYFLVLSDPENSLTGQDVRVIPLSKYVFFAKEFDLVFTEKLISFKPFGVVAHLHLASNLIKRRFKRFIGEIDRQIFNAIIRADMKDYSLIDETKVITGKNLKIETDDYIQNQAEVWYDIVQNIMEKLREEVFVEIGSFDELYENEVDLHQEPSMFIPESSEKMFLLSLVFDKHITKQNTYEIDEEGFLIVNDYKNILKQKFSPTTKFEKLNLRTKEVTLKEIKHLIYDELDNQKLEDYLSQLKKNFILVEPKKEFQESIKLAAKVPALSYDLQDYLTLFDDQKIQVLLSLAEKEFNFVISFLSQPTPDKIKNFHFVNLSEKTIHYIPEIKVEDGNVFIPFNLSLDELLSLQHGFIIGFNFYNTVINLHLKLVIN